MIRNIALSTFSAGARKSILVAASSLFALAIALLIAAPSNAGTIDYPGPMVGPGGQSGWMSDSVWFVGVSESNADTVERFGAPTGVGDDAIDFTPVDFEAGISQPGSSATDVVSSILNFEVIAKPGNSIDDLSFSESGSVALIALTGDQAYASVAAHFTIDILEVDGVAVGGNDYNIQQEMTFNPSDGTYEIGVDGSPGYNATWTGDLMVNIRQHLIDLGLDFNVGATKLNVSLRNTLTAGASGGGTAEIYKEDFDGVTITVNIPEPSTFVLAGMALAGLVGVRRFARS